MKSCFQSHLPSAHSSWLFQLTNPSCPRICHMCGSQICVTIQNVPQMSPALSSDGVSAIIIIIVYSHHIIDGYTLREKIRDHKKPVGQKRSPQFTSSQKTRPSADQKAARAIAVHHPSCIVHMRIYHRLGNSPLVFQFLHLPPFLPLAHPPDPSAPLSKNEQEKLGAYAPTEHQSNSTCRCSQ